MLPNPNPGFSRVKGKKLVILAHGHFPDNAKTALGVIRYSGFPVVAIVDEEKAGESTKKYLKGEPIPIVSSVEDSLKYKPEALLIGIAPIGGELPKAWRKEVENAINNGLDVISGLHYFIGDDPEFSSLAEERNVQIWDVRKPPSQLCVSKGLARKTGAGIVLTVGSDCSTGKMVTTLELTREAERRGWNAGFVPTGQTGVLVAGWGVVVDRVPSDFIAGAVEEMILQASKEYKTIFVEGQGSIIHPAYSGVTLGILHGAMPHAMILCHEAGRKALHGYEQVAIPPLSELVDLYENVSRFVAPSRVVGISLNTKNLDEKTARENIEAVETETGLPTTDVIRLGAGKLLDALEEQLSI
ncbi:MAG: DUF1611 domain-containing protein [Methanobacteriota archaeon]|nr:MAG: DUF1611 domain-containing protein [Euryarchaeota archaeon]